MINKYSKEQKSWKKKKWGCDKCLYLGKCAIEGFCSVVSITKVSYNYCYPCIIEHSECIRHGYIVRHQVYGDNICDTCDIVPSKDEVD